MTSLPHVVMATRVLDSYHSGTSPPLPPPIPSRLMQPGLPSSHSTWLAAPSAPRPTTSLTVVLLALPGRRRRATPRPLLCPAPSVVCSSLALSSMAAGGPRRGRPTRRSPHDRDRSVHWGSQVYWGSHVYWGSQTTVSCIEAAIIPPDYRTNGATGVSGYAVVLVEIYRW